MSVNTPILQQILSELVGLRQDVTELKTDVAVLKKDVAVLKTDVAVLKKDVAVLKKDMAKLKEDHSKLRYEFNEFRDNVVYYTKSQTLIQENLDIDLEKYNYNLEVVEEYFESLYDSAINPIKGYLSEFYYSV
jgi:chromosome segregation ATPase